MKFGRDVAKTILLTIPIWRQGDFTPEPRFLVGLPTPWEDICVSRYIGIFCSESTGNRQKIITYESLYMSRLILTQFRDKCAGCLPASWIKVGFRICKRRFMSAIDRKSTNIISRL